jgi:hypothetical protein
MGRKGAASTTFRGCLSACPGDIVGSVRNRAGSWRGGIWLVLALSIAACGDGTTTPADVSPDPQTATVQQGRFLVNFTVDRTTLRPGDNITGTAELRLVAGQSGALSGGQQTFLFEFVEIGGQNRVVEPLSDGQCAPHQIGLDSALVSPILKSGAASGGANAAFVGEFLKGDTINLPAGSWDITAIASFVDGRQCSGQPYNIRATIRVKVNA